VSFGAFILVLTFGIVALIGAGGISLMTPWFGRWRTHSGAACCGQCGYPSGGNDKCAECGATLSLFVLREGTVYRHKTSAWIAVPATMALVCGVGWTIWQHAGKSSRAQVWHLGTISVSAMAADGKSTLVGVRAVFAQRYATLPVIRARQERTWSRIMSVGKGTITLGDGQEVEMRWDHLGYQVELQQPDGTWVWSNGYLEAKDFATAGAALGHGPSWSAEEHQLVECVANAFRGKLGAQVPVWVVPDLGFDARVVVPWWPVSVLLVFAVVAGTWWAIWAWNRRSALEIRGSP
jgi:hypothetical protein